MSLLRGEILSFFYFTKNAFHKVYEPGHRKERIHMSTCI